MTNLGYLDGARVHISLYDRDRTPIQRMREIPCTTTRIATKDGTGNEKAFAGRFSF